MHLVIPLLSSPAPRPAPGPGSPEAVRALRPTVSDIVWNLHRIIVNPNSKLDEVRTARRRLLRLLKTNKFQEMVVPPLALPVEPADGATAATKRPDSTALCEFCGRPFSRRGEGGHLSAAERRRKPHDYTDRRHGEGRSSAWAASTDSAKNVPCLKVKMN